MSVLDTLDVFRVAETGELAELVQRRAENYELSQEVGYLGSQLRDVQEDLLRISDAFDNVGWSPLPQKDSKEIPLKTVKNASEVSRAMNAMNPFVKRGVNARISYVWGKGVSFDKIDNIQDLLDDNRKKLFSPQAFEERERVLATDGNLFLAHPLADARDDGELSFRIPLDKIDGVIANPRDREEIWYYKYVESVEVTNSRTGAVETKTTEKYYVSMDYYIKLDKQGKSLPRRWGKVGVEQNFVLQHVAVNKQVGWRWGVPDIMPVIYWAKAYKEYLEDNAMLVKAYSRLAWQVKTPSGQNGPGIASQLLKPPTRDPMTGELRDVGGTAVTGGGVELSPLATNASSIDFSKGSPLASGIAAGLEVSLVVITSDPGGAGGRATAETLDLPTLKAMESRQQLHTEAFIELFKFWEATEAVVTWPQIMTDTTLDRIKALGTAVELGVIYKEEARKEALDVLGVAPFKPWDELPTPEDDPYKMYEQQQAELSFQREQEAAKVVADQGVSGGVAAKGGTTAPNQARANRDANKNNS